MSIYQIPFSYKTPLLDRLKGVVQRFTPGRRSNERTCKMHRVTLAQVYRYRGYDRLGGGKLRSEEYDWPEIPSRRHAALYEHFHGDEDAFCYRFCHLWRAEAKDWQAPEKEDGRVVLESDPLGYSKRFYPGGEVLTRGDVRRGVERGDYEQSLLASMETEHIVRTRAGHFKPFRHGEDEVIEWKELIE